MSIMDSITIVKRNKPPNIYRLITEWSDRLHSILPTKCNVCNKMIIKPPLITMSCSGDRKTTKRYHIDCYPQDSRPK